MRLGEIVCVAAQIDADGGRCLRGEAQVGDGAHTVLHALDVRAHHSARTECVVVHDVVDGIVVEIQREFLHDGREMRTLELHSVAVAVELAAVHHAVRVLRPAAAAVVGDLKESVGVGGETEDAREAVAAVAGVDAPPVAVRIVARIAARLDDACVALRTARRDIGQLIKAVVRCAEDGDVAAYAGLFKAFRLAFKDDAARDIRPVADGLRPLVHNDAAERLGECVGRCGVHAVRTAARHHAAVHVHHHARAAHAAHHRIAAEPALADDGEAGDGLEIACTVGGGDGLARALRIGGEGERRCRAVARDNDLIEGELVHSVISGSGAVHRAVHIHLHCLGCVRVRTKTCRAERYAKQSKAAGGSVHSVYLL